MSFSVAGGIVLSQLPSCCFAWSFVLLCLLLETDWDHCLEPPEIRTGFTHENIQVTSTGALSPVPELLLKAEFLSNQP